MQASVRVVGADRALKALQVLEPSVAREVKRDLSKVGAMYKAAIADATPPGPGASHWRATSGARGSRGGDGWPAWSDLSFSVARRGLSIYIRGTSADGAIEAMYETMGRKTRVKTTQGEALIAAMTEKFGPVVKSGRKSGRLRRIAGENYATAIKDIEAACDRAVDEVNRRLP